MQDLKIWDREVGHGSKGLNNPTKLAYLQYKRASRA